MNWCNSDFQDPDSHYPRNRQRRIADRNKSKQQIQLLQQNIAAAGDDADRLFLRFKSTICEEELHFLEIKQPFDVVDEDLSQLRAILRRAPTQKLYLICESVQLLARDFRKYRKVTRLFWLQTHRNDRLFRQKVISASIPSIMFADSINGCASTINLLEASTRGTAVAQMRIVPRSPLQTRFTGIDYLQKWDYQHIYGEKPNKRFTHVATWFALPHSLCSCEISRYPEKYQLFHAANSQE